MGKMTDNPSWGVRPNFSSDHLLGTYQIAATLAYTYYGSCENTE